jgi:DNA sulfur modification protein DndD
MKILEIQIQNFKILRDFRLNLKNHKSNMVFVNGSNGHGKTSFLEALRWCIYEESVDSGNFFNHKAAKEIASTSDLESFVQLKILVDETGTTATVKRTQAFSKLDSTMQPHGSPQLTIIHTPGDTSQPTYVDVNPVQWLNDHFPERFRDFFLFNGELMYKFFDVSVKGAIEKAVREIAQIDLFDAITKDVKTLRDNLRTKAAKLSGSADAQELDAKHRAALATVDRLKAEFHAKESQLVKIRDQVKSLNASLSQFEQIKVDLQRNKELRNELEGLFETKRNLEQRLGKVLLETTLYGHLVSVSEYPLEKHIKTAKEQGRFPADFQPAALETLISIGECVCGRPLTEHDGTSESIRRTIERSISAGEIGLELQKLQVGFAEAKTITETNRSRLAEYKADLEKNQKSIQIVRKLMAELEPKLEPYDSSKFDIGRAFDELKTLQNEESELTQNLAFLKTELARAVEAEQTARRKFDTAVSRKSEATEVISQASFLDEVISQAEAFSGEVLRSVRMRLETFIELKFSSVKNGQFKTVINEDFEVETLNADGSKAILSEGEKMLKAYLFSIALREVIGLNFPLIVDTPFGRLGEQNRLRVAENLTGLLTSGLDSNHQVILLMHDAEYTPYTKKSFAPLDPFEGYLNLSSTGEESELGLGIDPKWMEFTAWSDWKKGLIASGEK